MFRNTSTCPIAPTRRVQPALILLIIAVTALLAVQRADATTYANVTDLVLEDMSFNNVEVINPIGSLTVRRCNFSGDLDVVGPMAKIELTVVIEDVHHSGYLRLRNLSLEGNSSIHATRVNGTQPEGYFFVVYVVFGDGVVFSLTNSSFGMFRTQFVTMRNTSLTVTSIVLPTEANDGSVGTFRLLDSRFFNSSLVVDGVTASAFRSDDVWYIDTQFVVSNSLFWADPYCQGQHCDVNFTQTAITRSNITFDSMTVLGSGFRFGGTNISFSNFTISQCNVTHIEHLSHRSGDTVVFVAGASVNDTTIAVINSAIRSLPGNLNATETLKSARAFYTVAPTWRSTFCFRNSTFVGMRSDTVKGWPVYFRDMHDSIIDIDTATWNAMIGSAYFFDIDKGNSPMIVEGISNMNLQLILRGDTPESDLIGEPVVVIRNSEILRVDILRIVCNNASGSRVEITDCTLGSLDLNNSTFIGAPLLLDNVTVSNTKDIVFDNLQLLDGATATIRDVSSMDIRWTGGSVTGSTMLLERFVSSTVVSIASVQWTQSTFNILNSSIAKGFSLTSSAAQPLNDVTVLLQNNSIGATTGTAVINIDAAFVNSTLRFAKNTVSTSLSPDVDGIALSGSVDHHSLVGYDENSIDVDVASTGILHTATTTGTVHFTPPALYPRNVGVSFRLDGPAVFNASWCHWPPMQAVHLELVNLTHPFILDGADSSLSVSCIGDSGSVPFYARDSRFGNLSFSNCTISPDAPFLLVDSIVAGNLTWAPSSVQNTPADALLFNTTVVGNLTLVGGSAPLTVVTRPTAIAAALRTAALINGTRRPVPWNAERCLPAAAPFSYTPSPSLSATHGTKTDSATPTASPSHAPSASDTATRSSTPPGTVTLTPSNGPSRSSSPTGSHSAAGTPSIEATPSLRHSATAHPGDASRTRSQSATPSLTASRSSSATASICAAIPAANVTAIATTQADLEAGPAAFELQLPLALARASGFVNNASTTTKTPTAAPVNATALRVAWQRPTEYLPSDLPAQGTLPPSAVAAAIVFGTAPDGINQTAALRVTVDLGAPATAAFSFDDGFPSLLAVALLPAFFAPGTGGYGCLDDLPSSVDIGTVDVAATPQPLLLATARAVQGVSSVAAAASSVAGGGAAGDAISLAILADMGCARPVLKEGGKNKRLLSPAGLNDSLAGMLSGSVLLILAAPVVHFAWALGVWRLRVFRGVGEARDAKRGATLTAAMVAVRFPSWSLGAHGTLHQGVVYVTARLVLGDAAHGEGSGANPGLAVAGVLLALLVPAALYLVAATCVRATYCEYDFGSCAPGSGPSRLWRAVLPRGRWEGVEVRRQLGVVFAPVESVAAGWALLPVLSPTMVAVIGSARPSTAAGCARQFALLAAVMASYGAFIAWRRPFRAALLNGGAVVSTVTLVGVAATSAAQAAGVAPASWSGRLMLVWIYLQMLATTARVGFVIVKLFLEARLTKRVGLIPLRHRTPARWWQQLRGDAAGGGLVGGPNRGVTWGELPGGYLTPGGAINGDGDNDGAADAMGKGATDGEMLALPLLPASARFGVPASEDDSASSMKTITVAPERSTSEATASDAEPQLGGDLDDHGSSSSTQMSSSKRASIFAVPPFMPAAPLGEMPKPRGARRRSYSMDHAFSISGGSSSPRTISGASSPAGSPGIPLAAVLGRQMPREVLVPRQAGVSFGPGLSGGPKAGNATKLGRRRRSMSL